ncbi:MAG: hypothetical protein KKG59_05860 [Nanoarchaeota archaeon]|nr:hypothetical protein [Nanoarchaeota archaeon]
MADRINVLLESSKQIMLDCCLENGAVVAANTDKAYYPKRCQSYRFVWPTDAAFTLLALNELGVRHVQEPYFKWLMSRVEDVAADGLLFQNYYTHGTKRWINFQPDSNGKTLWLIHDFFDGNVPKEWHHLMKLLSQALVRMWAGKFFGMKTQDRWEERSTYPDLEDNHTYSLAACVHGLRLAYKVLDDVKLRKVASEMLVCIDKAYQKCEQENKKSFRKNYFFRTAGKLSDSTVDASVLGLVWPFEIVSARDKRITDTVQVIEDNLVRDGGVMRYECDLYDGWTYHTEDRKKGAGTWPILTLFLCIYYARKGDMKKARKYYDWVVDKFNNCIPEQYYTNAIQEGVSPIAWNHAMFVFASKELGLLPKDQ